MMLTTGGHELTCIAKATTSGFRNLPLSDGSYMMAQLDMPASWSDNRRPHLNSSTYWKILHTFDHNMIFIFRDNLIIIYLKPCGNDRKIDATMTFVNVNGNESIYNSFIISMCACNVFKCQVYQRFYAQVGPDKLVLVKTYVHNMFKGLGSRAIWIL